MSWRRTAALAVALGAAVTDAATGRVPNALTLPALAAGVVAGSPLGAVVCATPFLPLFGTLRAGGGDVKLAAALGALLGWRAGLGVVAGAVALAWATGYRRLGVWALVSVSCS